MKRYGGKNLCTDIHSFILQQVQTPKCASEMNGFSAMWSAQAMEYYVAIKRE